MIKRKLFKNTAKRLPIKMHIYRQKHFNFISFWSDIMSLKSGQLELGFSIYVYFKHLDGMFIMLMVLTVYYCFKDRQESLYTNTGEITVF